MLKPFGLRKFLLAGLLTVVFDLVLTFYIGAKANSYDGDLSTSDGFSSIGNFFGNVTGAGIMLGLLIVLAMIGGGLYKLSQAGKHGAVVACTVVLVVIGAIVGVNWIHLSWSMLTPLLALAFVATQTWVVVRVTHKK